MAELADAPRQPFFTATPSALFQKVRDLIQTFLSITEPRPFFLNGINYLSPFSIFKNFNSAGRTITARLRRTGPLLEPRRLGFYIQGDTRRVVCNSPNISYFSGSGANTLSHSLKRSNTPTYLIIFNGKILSSRPGR